MSSRQRRFVFVSAIAGVTALAGINDAVAKHARHHLHPVRGSTMHAITPATGPAAGARDPFGFYWNGYEASRDPDPYVRQELQRDYWAIYRW